MTLITFESDPDLALPDTLESSFCFTRISGERLKKFNTLASEFALGMVGLDSVGIECREMEGFSREGLGMQIFSSFE